MTSPATARRRSAGLTLPEALIAMTIFLVVSVTISAIYFSAYRGWLRGAAENRAQSKLAWALRRMQQELRPAIRGRVTPDPNPYTGYGITVCLPAKEREEWEGTYFNRVEVGGDGQPYLVRGDSVHYYRGDDEANLDVAGSKLWRQLLPASGPPNPAPKLIVDNLQDNPVDAGTGLPKPIFVYWPSIFRVESVEITLTVEEKQATHRARVSSGAEVALRN